jgi:hypothetical protein
MPGHRAGLGLALRGQGRASAAPGETPADIRMGGMADEEELDVDGEPPLSFYFPSGLQTLAAA